MHSLPGKPHGARRHVFRSDNLSRYNATLALARRANLNGVYDIHTNMMHYPQIMQPTHARWEQVPASGEQPSEANGRTELTRDRDDAMVIDGEAKGFIPTVLSPVDPVISRNYMITDTHYEGPPKPDMPYPGPDGDMYDIGPGGLGVVKNDIIAELPEESKKAFFDAREVERQWKARWATEQEDGARAHLAISYNS